MGSCSSMNIDINKKPRRTEQSERKPYEKRRSDNVHKSPHEKEICFFVEIPKPIEIDDDDDDDWNYGIETNCIDYVS